MQGDHNVLVAAAHMRCESTGVIGENLVDGDDTEVGGVVHGRVVLVGARGRSTGDCVE